MGWFGSMTLAWKYAMVFGICLSVTLMAGFAKVLYDRNKLKKHTKDAELESGPKEDQMELNAREKDEGDLFGVRAIEAGYFAGIPQSRPSSTTGSIAGSPIMSTNTLASNSFSPKINMQSPSGSVMSLPLAHTSAHNSAGPMSIVLPDSSSPPRRMGSPTAKLRPSEAELSGRINHNAAVNMTLMVPPSPVLASGPRSPTFSGSDSEESDDHHSHRSVSPQSPTFPEMGRSKPAHYAPAPPQIPVPDGLRLSVRSVTAPENPAFDTKSQTASIENSREPSPEPSAPAAVAPTMPSRYQHDDPRSLFPASSDSRPSSTGKGLLQAGSEQPLTREVKPSSSLIGPLPEVAQPSHGRNHSSASSLYSLENRKSYHQQDAAESPRSSISYNYSFPEPAARNSVAQSLPPSREQSRRPSAASSLAPTSIHNGHASIADPRFSEFFDSYYRNSQYGNAQKTEIPKWTTQLNLKEATIVEAPSPLPSPLILSDKTYQPGMAL